MINSPHVWFAISKISDESAFLHRLKRAFTLDRSTLQSKEVYDCSDLQIDLKDHLPVYLSLKSGRVHDYNRREPKSSLTPIHQRPLDELAFYFVLRPMLVLSVTVNIFQLCQGLVG